MTQERVLAIAAPFYGKEKWWPRWINCYQKVRSKRKICVIASENEKTRQHLHDHFPFITVLPVKVWRPSFTNERVYAIAAAREEIRKWVCENPNVEWLLFIDIDVEYPADIVERILMYAQPNYDLVFSRRVGLISLMRREVCLSTHFYTAVNFRNPKSYLEEHFQIEKQLTQFNHVRPHPPYFRVKAFSAKWARHKDYPMGLYSK